MTDNLNPDGTPKRKRRKHSPETIKLMSERRRARTKQPREGQSKKRQNLYQELMHEYKNMKDPKKKAEVMKWLEENKPWLDTTAKETAELGIYTEYHEMYHNEYERRVGVILYDNEDVKNHGRDMGDPYNMVEGYEGELEFGGGDFDE